MTLHYKYQVTVGLKKYRFKTIKSICEFLNLSYCSVYNLRNDKIKYKQQNKKYLKDITIDKIEYERTHHSKNKQRITEIPDFDKRYNDGEY